MGDAEVRIQLDGLSPAIGGFVELVLMGEALAQAAPGGGERGFGLDRFAIGLFGLVDLVARLLREGEVEVGHRVGGIERRRFGEGDCRFVQLRIGAECDAERVPELRFVRLRLHGLVQQIEGPPQVVLSEMDQAEQVEGFAVVRVDRKYPLRGFACDRQIAGVVRIKRLIDPLIHVALEIGHPAKR